MDINEEHKEHLDHLLDIGEKLEAVRYLQENFNLSADQALALAEKLDEQRIVAEGNEIQANVSTALATANKVPKIVGTIFGTLGLVFLAVAVLISYREYQFGKTAEHVSGKVIELNSYESRDKDTGNITIMYKPVVAYLFEGKSYTYRSNTATSPPSHDVGEEVDLLINPEEPENPEINSFIDRWLVSIIFGFMGVLFAGIGFGIRKAFATTQGTAT